MEILLFTTRLAIIACRHMVPHYYRGEVVKIPDIAQIYGFNTRSVSPSFTALVKGGVLTSRVGGRFEERGFSFARDPKEIKLYDIVRVLEGDDSISCCRDKIICRAKDCSGCSIKQELQKVMDYRQKLLSTTTIFDHYEMLARQNEV